MGTWDEGILDNDASLDGLGELSRGVLEDVLGAGKPSKAGAARLCGAVGVLLQLSPFDFGDEAAQVKEVRKALRAWLDVVPAEASKVLQRVASGPVEEEEAKLPKPVAALLHKSGRSGFGAREDTLFESKEAKAYVGEVIERCVEAMDEDFAEEWMWSDLCREANSMGMLGALLVLEPGRAPKEKLERWRACAQKGLAQLVEDEDEELGFQRSYYQNLDGVFAALLEG